MKAYTVKAFRTAGDKLLPLRVRGLGEVGVSARRMLLPGGESASGPSASAGAVGPRVPSTLPAPDC